MSWLSNAWHSITGTPTGGQQAQNAAAAAATQVAINNTNDLLAKQTASAKAAADLALQAQQDANKIAAANAVPPADNEVARATSDEHRRKLLAGSSFGIGLPTQLGAPPVGYRMLAGQ